MILAVAATSFALKKGDLLPALSGKTLTGETFDFSSLKGHPVLLKVGTTWCPTCGQEAAEIEQIRDFLAENGIKYVEVFIQETASTVRSYLDREGHRKPDVVILDDGAIGKALNIYQIPRVLMIDSNMIVYRDGRPLLAKTLQQELQKMVEEK